MNLHISVLKLPSQELMLITSTAMFKKLIHSMIILFIILIHLSTGVAEIGIINSRTKQGIQAGCLKAENAANLLVSSPEALLRTAKITAIAIANTATKVTGQVLSASVHLLNLIIIWVIHRYTKLVVCVFDTITGVLLDAVKAFASSKLLLL